MPGRSWPDRSAGPSWRWSRADAKAARVGVAYYRPEQGHAAVKALECAYGDSASPAIELFSLALSYQELGQAGKAQDATTRRVTGGTSIGTPWKSTPTRS